MRRFAVAAALSAAALYVAAQAALSTKTAEDRLRARIAAALGERLADPESLAVRVDWALRPSFGPLVLRARAGGEPVLSIARARVEPSLRALLRGRLEPAALHLAGVELSGPAALGPTEVELRQDGADGARRVEAALRLPGGARAALSAVQDGGRWRARLRAAEIGPEDLPAALRTASARVAAGSLALDVEADAAPDLSRGEASIRIAAVGVALSGARVAPSPVQPLRAFASLAASWDVPARRLAIRDGVVSLLGCATVSVVGEVRGEPGVPFQVSLRAPRVDYAALVAALPPALAPPPEAPRPPGALGARIDLAGPLAAPADWTIDASLDLARLRETARRAPSPLRAPFVHRPDPAEPRRIVVVGPASPDFVPIAELPEHVIRAVTTSEDAGFFAHDGFDFDELRNALAEGAEAGRVVRGGSTITQQVAKNLFLSPERTFARKVKEAVIAIGLEATLPKRRLLEIYLNVAEWGPGIWGIGPAARHWFGKDARALTPKEAAFLASIIPSPIRYHAMFERGSASEAWEDRVNGILLRMTQQGALTDDELVDGLSAPLSFAGG